MKVEVKFLGDSIDTETYEAKYVSWVFGDGLLVVFTGPSKGGAAMAASYPQGRVVRVRVAS